MTPVFSHDRVYRHASRHAPARLSSAAYAQSGGTVCPFCKEPTVDVNSRRMEEEYDENGHLCITRPASCGSCGARWTEIYRLKGYQQ